MIFQDSLDCPRCGRRVEQDQLACSCCCWTGGETKKRERFKAPHPDVNSLISDAPAIEIGKSTRQERNGYEL